MGKYTYFTDDELNGLDPEFCAQLDMARKASGVPYIITNGKRTPNDSAMKDPNAVKDSAHLVGLAVDLACADYRTLWAILKGCYAVGITRIGVYVKIDAKKKDRLNPTHVHIDVDKTKSPEVIWTTLEE